MAKLVNQRLIALEIQGGIMFEFKGDWKIKLDIPWINSKTITTHATFSKNTNHDWHLNNMNY